jgi:hypothetical protein
VLDFDIETETRDGVLGHLFERLALGAAGSEHLDLHEFLLGRKPSN